MEILTKNGNKSIEIKPANFQEAINLKKAAMKCLQESKVLENINFESVELAALIDKFLEVLFSAEASTTFEKALFECLKVCYINENGIKNKISPQLFDEKPELREDYYEIISKCVEVNLAPFFKSLVSEFKTRFNQQIQGSLQQK